MSPPRRVRDRLTDAKERAATDFAQHEVRVLAAVPDVVTVYRCRRPGTGMHGFDVVVRPGQLWLTGDVGDLVLNRGGLALVGGERDNHEYLLSKAPAEMRDAIEQWDDEIPAAEIAALEKWLFDSCDPALDSLRVDELKEGLPYESPDDWARAWCDAFGDHEGLVTRRTTWHAYYQVEALKWLAARVCPQECAR